MYSRDSSDSSGGKIVGILMAVRIRSRLGYFHTCWYDSSAVKNLGDILITIVVLGGILVLSGIFTSVFTRKMYYRCSECRELNAKRRSHCRICGNELPNPNREKA
ncbi:MAG: hypothetical protein WBV94_01355 [Blastocatellia bacterium]